MAKWCDRPTKLLKIDEDIDYIMCIDENGCSNIENARKKILNGKSLTDDETYFTLTGCIFTRDEYFDAKEKIKTLKYKYWSKGVFFDKKIDNDKAICFHSREIRKHDDCFNEKFINYENFMIDLTDTMKSVDCKIISIGIDLYKYIKKDYTHEIYNVAFDFMLERYIYETENHKKGIILLESRGRIDDVNLLKHIYKIINKTGEKKISRKELRNKIKGVYFNPKWSDDYRSTFIGLEIADLFSYPIYKYIKRQHKDKAFLTFEEKIVGYPKYENKGIKRFPSQNKN